MKTRIGLLFLQTALASAATVLVVGCGKAPDTAGMAPPSVTVGTEIDDSVITARVKSALLADPDVKSFDFKVETRKGEVLLSGFVDNQAQLDRAASVTAAVAGVKSVLNKTNLKGGPNTVGELVDDVDVTARVKTALLRDDNVKSFDIAVVTRKGDAQLSGFVDNQRQIDLATEVARKVEGVHSVHNELSIKK